VGSLAEYAIHGLGEVAPCRYVPKQSWQIPPDLLNPLYTLILFAAFLTLVGVAPAASASLARSPL